MNVGDIIRVEIWPKSKKLKFINETTEKTVILDNIKFTDDSYPLIFLKN